MPFPKEGGGGGMGGGGGKQQIPRTLPIGTGKEGQNFGVSYARLLTSQDTPGKTIFRSRLRTKRRGQGLKKCCFLRTERRRSKAMLPLLLLPLLPLAAATVRLAACCPSSCCCYYSAVPCCCTSGVRWHVGAPVCVGETVGQRVEPYQDRTNQLLESRVSRLRLVPGDHLGILPLPLGLPHTNPGGQPISICKGLSGMEPFESK